jgi:hypothetical protein
MTTPKPPPADAAPAPKPSAGDKKPAKFTEASLRAAGFKVPPPDKGGVVIVPVGTGKPRK